MEYPYSLVGELTHGIMNKQRSFGVENHYPIVPIVECGHIKTKSATYCLIVNVTILFSGVTHVLRSCDSLKRAEEQSESNSVSNLLALTKNCISLPKHSWCLV